MRRAAARGVYSRVARASPTDLPRIWSRTSRAFRAETRTNRARATVFMGSPRLSQRRLASHSVASPSAAAPETWLRLLKRASARSATFIRLGLSRRGGGGLLGLAVRLERARERELAEPVADHVLGHVDGNEL